MKPPYNSTSGQLQPRKLQSMIYRYRGILKEQEAQKHLFENERAYLAATIKTMYHINLAQKMLLKTMSK